MLISKWIGGPTVFRFQDLFFYERFCENAILTDQSTDSHMPYSAAHQEDEMLSSMSARMHTRFDVLYCNKQRATSDASADHNGKGLLPTHTQKAPAAPTSCN